MAVYSLKGSFSPENLPPATVLKPWRDFFSSPTEDFCRNYRQPEMVIWGQRLFVLDSRGKSRRFATFL